MQTPSAPPPAADEAPAAAPQHAPLIDPFGRPITYLRLSVTDRCDYRCRYCMAEDIRFLPRAEVLSLEELDRLASIFVGLGVRRLRVTGGEPLVRRNVLWLFRRLARHLADRRLDEVTVTTNGSQLAGAAGELAAAGVRRINVSLDSLDPDRFRAITRRGRLDDVLAGLAAARQAGLRVRINTVALAGINEDEIDRLIAWCGGEGFDLCLIETMPMGDIGSGRRDHYLPLDRLRRELSARWTLLPTQHRTGGPARYVRIAETGGRLGFITPLTHNFCDACNRVRLTCTGRLTLCLGQEASADLRRPLRDGPDDEAVIAAIRAAVARKPKGHDFIIDRLAPAVRRFMSETGG